MSVSAFASSLLNFRRNARRVEMIENLAIIERHLAKVAAAAPAPARSTSNGKVKAPVTVPAAPAAPATPAETIMAHMAAANTDQEILDAFKAAFADTAAPVAAQLAADKAKADAEEARRLTAARDALLAELAQEQATRLGTPAAKKAKRSRTNRAAIIGAIVVAPFHAARKGIVTGFKSAVIRVRSAVRRISAITVGSVKAVAKTVAKRSLRVVGQVGLLAAMLFGTFSTLVVRLVAGAVALLAKSAVLILAAVVLIAVAATTSVALVVWTVIATLVLIAVISMFRSTVARGIVRNI